MPPHATLIAASREQLSPRSDAMSGGGEHHQRRPRVGELFLVVLIIFVSPDGRCSRSQDAFFVNERASTSLPRAKRQLPGAIFPSVVILADEVSSGGPTRFDAEVDAEVEWATSRQRRS